MEKSCDYFLNKGYSCSESVVMGAAAEGLVPEELVNVATPFCGGLGQGCLCGAVSGAQIVIGYLYGRNKANIAKAFGRKYMEEFKKVHKVTCCKVLTANFKENFNSPERKCHCVNMVESSSKILKEILKEAKETVG